MDALTWFGFLSLTGMLVCYALERRSHWYMLGFAVGCVLGSVYGFLQGAWPFGVVEAIWTVVALRRWHDARVRNIHADDTELTNPTHDSTEDHPSSWRSHVGAERRVHDGAR